MAEVLPFPVALESVERADVPGADTLAFGDQDARRAALDIRRSWIVEAPAGSGKTGLLIQRLLKLLAFGDVQRPAEVLAITFTRKAAAELRSRVLEQLEAAARATPLNAGAGEYEKVTREFAMAALARDRQYGWHLLDTPQGLNIRTIDSFCGELAASLPLLSRGGGTLRPVNDAEPVYELAAERTLRQLGGADPSLDQALLRVLLHRDGQLGEVTRLIAGMLRDREQWGELVPLDPDALTDAALDGPVKRRLESTLERIVCEGLSAAAHALGPERLAELSHFAARASELPGYKGAPSPLLLCAGRPHTPSSQADALDHWRSLLNLLLRQDGEWRSGVAANHLGFHLPRAEAQWLKDFVTRLRMESEFGSGLREALCAVRDLPPATYPDDQWQMAKALFLLLRRALAELSALFAERNACDFTEVSLTARRLLRSGSDVLPSSVLQLSHLLVDEMQDTSSGQYELFELLTRHWDGATQTIFLVGDPKQSIYLFRQARVARFLRTQESRRLGDVPLGALRLTANFRSQACLVEQFNQTFSRMLPSPGERLPAQQENNDVPFVAAVPTRAGKTSPALQWHGRRLGQDPAKDRSEHPEHRDGPDAEVENEAAEIRRTIENFLIRCKSSASGRGADQSTPKIAVLARNRAHLAPIIAEFQRDHGRGSLLFRAVDIELLSERPEVLDLVALTRALLHPGDRVAWLAVLHSPMCGLEVADLLALTGEGPDAETEATVAHLVRMRTDQLSEIGQQLLRKAWKVLSEAQATLGRTAMSTSVERTWRSLGADLLLRADQQSNTRRFFDFLRRTEQEREPLTVALLERGLRKLYAEPLTTPGAVELLTIHKAKGLEWDLVLVPALERGSGNTQHELLKWLELDGDDHSEAGVILAPIQGKGQDSSALSKWLSGVQTARQAAEVKRLFYVACTRAREELHLFAACKITKTGELATPRHDSLLRASWVAAQPILSRQLIAGAECEPKELTSASERDDNITSFPPSPAAQTLAIAAAGVETPADRSSSARLERLPFEFDPLQRFRVEPEAQLPYPPAGSLRNAAPFARPEGSFAARAFGNIMHRFLDLIARRLKDGMAQEALLAELRSWGGRVHNSFRGEGLPPALCARETERALRALENTLRDPTGHWILSSHEGARSECALLLPDTDAGTSVVRNLRADRIFVAGSEPLTRDQNTHLWIVDFKTAEQGGRSDDAFFTAEKAKYAPQMHAYAEAHSRAQPVARPIVLALFYPLITRLLYWTFQAPFASQ